MYDKAYNQAANIEPYQRVIDQLLDNADLRSSDENLEQARRLYLKIAIHKGYPFLSKGVADIAELSVAELQEAAEQLPDKQGKGWNGTTSLNNEDRQNFVKWAEDRREGIWNNFFTHPDTTDVIISFSAQDPDTTESLLNQFFENYNARAVQAYNEALLEDEAILRSNPSSFPNAGRDIEQRQIRLDPENSKLIQSFDSKKEKWVAGPKIGKFLQDNYEWKLFDLMQQIDEAQSKNQNNNRKGFTSFLEIIGQESIDCDPLLEAGELRILISSDPRKIGEMSTGQRWSSCMSRDGMNYRYVESDIRHGTLVAYVIHKDDTEARYPLMRQLIKPYINNNGDMIFVPARVYGGEGRRSIETAVSLGQSLVEFAAKHNNHAAFDNYSMISSLYSDGQATSVNLKESWQDDQIHYALKKFQDESIEEWMTELIYNLNRARNGELGMYGEDAAVTAKKYIKKLENILQATDSLVGLPRIFYREQTRSTVGVNANPKDIERVAAEHPKLERRQNIYEAIRHGDLDVFRQHEEKIKSGKDYDERRMLEKIVSVAALSAKPKDAICNSLDVMECLAKYVRGQYDEYGEADFSVQEEILFSHIMDVVMANAKELTEEQIEAFSKFATDSLEYTTRNQRRVKVINSSSWMDGQYEIRYDFDPSSSEEVFAEKWISMMDLLRQHNPDLAEELAQDISKQYTKELAYTAQHKYAREFLYNATDVSFNIDIQEGSVGEIAESLGSSLSVFQANRSDIVTDGLTGLYNRSGFFELLGKKEVAVGEEKDSKLKLIRIDIKNFKVVNDSHGHAIGDIVLQEVSTRINNLFKGDEHTLIGRIDGDEIAIITSENKNGVNQGRIERALAGVNPVLLEKASNEQKPEVQSLAA